MTIEIGPLALPGTLLAAFAAILLGLVVGQHLAGKRGVSAEGSLWLVVLGAVLMARLAFVVRYWNLYEVEPWRLPDLRDGGLDVAAGLAGAVLIAAVLAWRRVEQRGAIAGGVSVGIAIWLAATGLLGMAQTRQALPQVTLVDLEGNAVPLSAFAGKPVVVNLWASWCPPCRREMPVLEKAQQDAPDVHFVFVNQGEDAVTVRRYLHAGELQLKNVLLDYSGQLPKATGSLGLPTTLFFDASGKLVDKRMGEVSPATLARHLEAARGDAAAPAAMQLQ